MKTMKLLVMLVALTLSTSAMAQNSFQQRIKANKQALKEKASKDARKEAKRLKSEGWTVDPGGLPLEKQCDRWFFYQDDINDDMEPNWYTGSQSAIAENFAAAKMQATELARLEIAASIGTEATGIVDNLIANKMLANDQAATITTYMSENKTIFSQKLGRVTQVMVLNRVLKNNFKEVMVRLVYKTSEAKEIAKQVVREKLESDSKQLGQELNDELKAFFDN